MSSAHTELYKGKIFTVLFAVFLGGAAAGAVGMKVYHDRVGTNRAASSPTSLLAVDHLAAELDLDDRQYSEVRSVLDECIMHEADMMNRIRILRDGGRESIYKILNQEQQREFELLLNQAFETLPAH